MSIIEHILKLRDEASPALKKMAEGAEDAEDALKALKNVALENAEAQVQGAAKIQLALAKELQAIDAVAARHKGNGAVMMAADKARAEARKRYGQEAQELYKKEQEAQEQAIEASARSRAEMLKWGAAIATAAATGLVMFVKSVHDARNELAQMAAETGATASEIQAVQLAAAASGQTVTDMNFALEQMRDKPEILAAFNDQARMFGATYGPDAVQATKDWNAATSELKTLVGGLGERMVTAFGGNLIANFTRGLIAAASYLHGFFDSVFKSIGDNMLEVGLMLTSLTTASVTSIPGLLLQFGSKLRSGLADANAAGMEAMQKNVATLDKNRAAIAVGVPTLTPPSGTGGGSGGGSGSGGAASGKADGTKSAPLQVVVTKLEPEATKALVTGVDRNTERQLGAVFQGLGAARGAMGGDLGGLIGGLSGTAGSMAGVALGPIGAIAGQAVGLLQELGTTGAEGVKNAILDNARSIINGIRELPTLIADVVPEVLIEVLPALVEALVEKLPEIILAQYELIARLIVMQFSTLPEMLAEAIVTGLFKLWDSVKQFFSDLFTVDRQERGKTVGKAARVGAAIGTLGLSEIAIAGYKGVDNALEKRGGKGLPFFWSGGRMPWDGLAFLHAGERVVPSDGAGSGTTSRGMGGGGGGAVFNFNGPVVDHRGLIDLINRTLGTRGANKGIG